MTTAVEAASCADKAIGHAQTLARLAPTIHTTGASNEGGSSSAHLQLPRPSVEPLGSIIMVRGDVQDHHTGR